MVAGHRRKLNMVGDELPSLVLNDEVIKSTKALTGKSNIKLSRTHSNEA